MPGRRPLVDLSGFVQRVHDVLTAIAYVRAQGLEVELHGLPGAGHVAAAARYIAGAEVHHAVIEFDDFRWRDMNQLSHPDFVPGAVKYGDVEALSNLCRLYPSEVRGLEGREGLPR